jgi:hypothetical protein
MSEVTPTVERWLPLPGYEGFYEVSDLGRVRSHRRRGSSGRLKRFYMDPKDGYACLVLYARNEPGRRARVHVLVAQAFLGPRPDGYFVCHRDGDPANNRLENLYYGTPSDNVRDTMRHGRHWQVQKTHCPRGHPYSPENTRIWGPTGNHRKCRACERVRREERRAAA